MTGKHRKGKIVLTILLSILAILAICIFALLKVSVLKTFPKWKGEPYNGPSNPDHSYAKEREHGMIKKNRKGAQYHGTQTVHSAV